MAFTGAFPWHGGKSKLAPKIIPYFPAYFIVAKGGICNLDITTSRIFDAS